MEMEHHGAPDLGGYTIEESEVSSNEDVGAMSRGRRCANLPEQQQDEQEEGQTDGEGDEKEAEGREMQSGQQTWDSWKRRKRGFCSRTTPAPDGAYAGCVRVLQLARMEWEHSTRRTTVVIVGAAGHVA